MEQKQNQNHFFEQKPFDWDATFDKDQLPDPQNFHVNDVVGGQVPIQKVGISKLDIPINLLLRNQKRQLVHGKVSAYVSLDSIEQRGINMSRLSREFYKKIDETGGVDLHDFLDVVENYRHALPSKNAYLKVRFDFPMQKKALREQHLGWIYYPVELEIINKQGKVETFLTIKYTYSSACPCSKALAEYSREQLNTPSISHSQRSIASIKIKFDFANIVWIEEMVEMAREAQPSELLPGIVTRVGEFSFAQLVAAQGVTGFVEDCLRRFYAVFNNDSRVLDFVVSVEHQESLNQNYATGVIYKGIPGGLS